MNTNDTPAPHDNDTLSGEGTGEEPQSEGPAQGDLFLMGGEGFRWHVPDGAEDRGDDEEDFRIAVIKDVTAP